MKFTVERRTLVRMLELIGPKAPSQTWRDKEVRLSACAARVFVEANESAGGTEALVLEDGTCLLNFKLFLKLLKSHTKKKIVHVEVNAQRIKFVTTTLPVTKFSRSATPPGEFKIYPVTDGWLTMNRSEASEIQEKKTQTKLPNAEKLIIEREKIVDYLLNPEHHIGSSKANFFGKFGFCVEKWEVLAEALRIHGQTNEVEKIYETGFGPRYLVEGKLKTPDGRNPHIRSVWQLDKDAVAPKLITAYPLETR
jgi:hypothetical protein